MVAARSAAGVDGIHWDVMDGNAVPALSFGPDIISACRGAVEMPFEAHVMSRRAEAMIDALASAGCRAMVVHPDWLQNPRRALQRIREAGMAAGVALSPGTPVAFARWHLDLVERILVMSVEPGYGGQRYIPAMTEKVTEIAALARAAGRPIIVEVDGRIGPETVPPLSRRRRELRHRQRPLASCRRRRRSPRDPLGGGAECG